MIKSWNLDSKARLVAEEIPYLKSAAIGIYIQVGSRHEADHMAGASHFIEHMLFKGTEQRSAREIAESFEGIGGQLNAYTSKEYTCVYARTLDENIFEAMDIIFDMLFKSKFNEREFATEKEVIIEEINMYEDTPDELIHDVFYRELWPGSSMGMPILGTLASVTALNRDEIYNFYKHSYLPSNMVIAIAGNINAEQIKDRIEEHLSQQPLTRVSLEAIEPPHYSAFTKLLPKDTEQVQICLGVTGMSYHDPNRYTLNVMNSILGGGMSSRLFQSIREQLGLAYSVYSAPSNYSDTGSYSLLIGTGPNKVGKFFEELHKELKHFLNDGVKPEEVKRAQQLIKSSMYLGLESVISRMTRLGRSRLMYDEIMPVDEVIAKIFAVNDKSVNDLARELMEEHDMSMAAIGAENVLASVEHEFYRWWR